MLDSSHCATTACGTSGIQTRLMITLMLHGVTGLGRTAPDQNPARTMVDRPV